MAWVPEQYDADYAQGNESFNDNMHFTPLDDFAKTLVTNRIIAEECRRDPALGIGLFLAAVAGYLLVAWVVLDFAFENWFGFGLGI